MKLHSEKFTTTLMLPPLFGMSQCSSFDTGHLSDTFLLDFFKLGRFLIKLICRLLRSQVCESMNATHPGSWRPRPDLDGLLDQTMDQTLDPGGLQLLLETSQGKNNISYFMSDEKKSV